MSYLNLLPLHSLLRIEELTKSANQDSVSGVNRTRCYHITSQTHNQNRMSYIHIHSICYFKMWFNINRTFPKRVLSQRLSQTKVISTCAACPSNRIPDLTGIITLREQHRRRISSICNFLNHSLTLKILSSCL
jgi:hypothetical protein